MLAQRECARLQQRQRERGLRTASGGEQHAETAIGMAHEVGTIAHEAGDVVGVTQEVLADGRRTPPVTTPVRHHQSKAGVGERALCLPLVRSRRQRAVHQHDGHTNAPRFSKQIAHGQVLLSRDANQDAFIPCRDQ